MIKTPTKAWRVTIVTTTTEGVEYSSTTRANSQKEVDRILKDARDLHLSECLRLSGLPDLKTLQKIYDRSDWRARKKSDKLITDHKFTKFDKPSLKVSVQPLSF